MTMTARIVGRYDLGPLLSEGAMGVVHRGKDRETGRPVALKTLTPEQQAVPRNLACLKMEYALARGIGHPNVIRFLDWVEDGGRPFLVMELVKGMDLRARLAGRRLPVAEGLEVAKGIAAALRAVHEQDPKRPLVHADVKPENVMLRAGEGELRKEQVVLVDFGTAMLASHHGAVHRALSRVAGIFQGPQVVGGSSLYMSPEQASKLDVGIDPRADLYALGGVMFEIFTGRPPFLNQVDEQAFSDNGRVMLSSAEHLLAQHFSDELKLKHLTAAAPSPRRYNTDLPEAIEQIILRCLEKRPERRFQSALELLTVLGSLKVDADGTVIATRKIHRQPDGQPRSCLLKVVSGPLKGRELPLDQAGVKVGRKVGSGGLALPEEDKKASGEHALFQRSGEQVSVADLGSRNGTFVNGTRVTRAKLKDGDKVAVGGTVIKVSIK